LAQLELQGQKLTAWRDCIFCRKGVMCVATNPPTGDGRRQGAVRDRSQAYNPQNGRWVKRDADTGRFMDQKADNKPFKGVRRER
jgi:hypothetical protein